MTKTIDHKHPAVEYVTGIVTAAGSIVVIAADSEDVNRTNSIFAIRKGEKWVRVFVEKMDVVSLDAGGGPYERHLAALGVEGTVYLNEPSAVHRERVHKGKGGPSKLRQVHEIRAIGDSLVVVGMRRQAYKRALSGGGWSRFDQGVVLPERSTELLGFYSVDGFSEDEIYAVGLGGEIWICERGIWGQVESPTNVPLLSVRCGIDGVAVACGQDGVVLRGRGSQWNVVAHGDVDVTLDCIAQFRGTWYLTDEEGGLYVLADGGLSIDSRFAESNVVAGTLDSTNDTLLCVGPEEVMVFDGSVWQRLPHPPIQF